MCHCTINENVYIYQVLSECKTHAFTHAKPFSIQAFSYPMLSNPTLAKEKLHCKVTVL